MTMQLKERLLDKGYDLKNLEPWCLYITIAVPDPRPGEPHTQHPTIDYFPYIPDDFDTATYETSCAEGLGREEFDWGLYWHRGPGDGTWYRLHRVSPTIDVASMDARDVGGVCHICSPPLPSYHLSRNEMPSSPRLLSQVVGLIRVLHVPRPIAHGLTSYLDWLAGHAAASATRSFIWATSLYLRTRRHLSADPLDRVGDRIAAGFDITGFLWEALDFAYEEVWYSLAGQLPRPIVASAFGVELLLTRTG